MHTLQWVQGLHLLQGSRLGCSHQAHGLLTLAGAIYQCAGLGGLKVLGQ